MADPGDFAARWWPYVAGGGGLAILTIAGRAFNLGSAVARTVRLGVTHQALAREVREAVVRAVTSEQTLHAMSALLNDLRLTLDAQRDALQRGEALYTEARDKLADLSGMLDVKTGNEHALFLDRVALLTTIAEANLRLRAATQPEVPVPALHGLDVPDLAATRAANRRAR